MKNVAAKKSLGQHFLNNEVIAMDIANALETPSKTQVIEIGPGMGVLTKYLVQNPNIDLKAVELDGESVNYLLGKPVLQPHQIVHGDFLKLNLDSVFQGQVSIIGNFPYNISSQIMFKVIENKENVHQVVGMFQKEVAERLANGPGTRDYGILSVYLQAFYNVKYLFTVLEHEFSPPPKVKSGVIIATRKDKISIPVPEHEFLKVVKISFNQRRKVLSNGLKAISNGRPIPAQYASKRAEQLGVEDFFALTQWFLEGKN